MSEAWPIVRLGEVLKLDLDRVLVDAATSLGADIEPPAIDADQQCVRAAGFLLPRDQRPQEWAAVHLADGRGRPVYSL